MDDKPDTTGPSPGERPPEMEPAGSEGEPAATVGPQPPTPPRWPAVPVPDWRAAGRELAADVGEVVADIQQTVAALSAREQELERREQQLAEEYRQLLNKARSAALAELEAERQALARERALLQAQAAPVEVPPPTVAGPPRRWWLRSTVLALLAGAVAAGGWLAANPSLYRSSIELHVNAETPTSEPADSLSAWMRRLLALHRANLLDPQSLTDAGLPDEVRRTWLDAWGRGRGRIAVDEEQRILRVELVGPDPALSAHILRTVVTRYADYANATHRDTRLPPSYLEQVLWRDELRAALKDAEEREAKCAAELATLPAAEDRQRLLDQTGALRAELATLAEQLQTARAELTTLLARDDPRGVITEAEVDAALRADPMYSEDQRELHACTQKYRTELTVSLLLVTEPLKALHKALREYTQAIREQQDLRPSPELAGVLDACAADVATAVEATTTFSDSWRLTVQAVQQVESSPERAESAAPDLVQRHGEAVRALDDFSRTAAAAVDRHGQRLTQITDNGGTREQVVAASLRGHHSTWRAAIDALAAATARTTLDGNIELAALERQVRGVLTRLRQRRELVQQRLQSEADRAAREQHAARTAEARARVVELEQRREETIARVLATVAQMQALEDATNLRAEHQAALQQSRLEMQRISRQLQSVEERLTALRSNGVSPERLEVSEVRVTALPHARYAKAAVVLAGTGTFAWLMCFLTVARRPHYWR